MLLHDSRREARLDGAGDLVVLEEQDRSRWNKEQIEEALPLTDEAFLGEHGIPGARYRAQRGQAAGVATLSPSARGGVGPGPYALQAAIVAVHCQAERAEDTDWPRIVRLYNQLKRLQPSPIVSLNRAVAIAMVDGPRSGLALIDALATSGDLDGYHLLHAARADLLRRLGSSSEAAKSYTRALELVTNESERRFLEKRLREVNPG